MAHNIQESELYRDIPQRYEKWIAGLRIKPASDRN